LEERLQSGQRDERGKELSLQRFAVKLNRNTVNTPALAQEVFSEEKHASIVKVAQ
jgi:hypothetical protein